jgi:hypothetical protein
MQMPPLHGLLVPHQPQKGGAALPLVIAKIDYGECKCHK